MSINNFTEVQGFSISGLQNITADTINGSTVLTTITIAGQTAFLSYDSTTSTLTLLIPTSNGVVPVGLLSATDWNTFNSKESLLTFTSPLTRVGNTISFDFTQSLTFNGNTQTLNNNTIISGGLFYTGAVSTTTPDILYIDNATGFITKGPAPPSTNILPLNNIWTGSSNTFRNEVIVENLAQLQYAFRAYINKFVHPTLEYFYVEVNGDVGFFGQLNPLFPLPSGGPVWKITSSGDASFISSYIQNTLVVENLQNAGDVMQIYRDGNGFPTEYLYFNNSGTLGYNIAGGWNITSVGDIICRNINTTASVTAGNSLIVENDSIATIPFRVYKNRNAQPDTYFFYNALTDSVGFQSSSVSIPWFINSNGNFFGSNITVSGTTNRNDLRFTHIEQSPSINTWIAAEFSYDAIDKVVIGNLGLAVGGRRACIGAHDTTLSAWRELDLNPFELTVSGSLTVIGLFTNLSDRRVKKDIQYLDANKSFNFIKRLKPCIYRRCEDINDPYMKNEDQPKRKLQLGFIADEILDIAETEAQKSLITTFKYAGYDDCKQLAMIQLIPEIVQANKEMIDKIERLETENKLLQERLLKIENLIARKKCLAFI